MTRVADTHGAESAVSSSRLLVIPSALGARHSWLTPSAVCSAARFTQKPTPFCTARKSWSRWKIGTCER